MIAFIQKLVAFNLQIYELFGVRIAGMEDF